MNAYVAGVAKDHLVAVFAIQREADVAGYLVVELDAHRCR